MFFSVLSLTDSTLKIFKAEGSTLRYSYKLVSLLGAFVNFLFSALKKHRRCGKIIIDQILLYFGASDEKH